MARVIDGRAIARDVLAQVKTETGQLGSVIVRAITAAPSPATLSYLSIKKKRAADAGMTLEVIRLPDEAREDALINAIRQEGADAVIVQLPLPEHIDTPAVLDAVPLALDADVLSIAARTAYASEEPDALLPPVVAAIAEIFVRSNVEIAGKRAVVVGNGWLVGAPAARWLRSGGAEVAIITKEDPDYGLLRDADIVVSGAGSPGLIRSDHLKEGVVLIDAGTSESRGQMVGDADPACADVASLFTPVPGGVGPIAAACLFRNVLELTKRGRLQAP